MTQNLIKTMLVLAMISLTTYTQAQDWKTDRKILVVFGLTQPLLVKGFNIEGNYIYNRFIFDYSHGVSLDFSGTTATPELQRQELAVHMPWTTGFGVGYRFTEWINVRLEPKWHRFELYYDGEPQNPSTEITSFNTMSLGIGIYGNYQPFKKQENFLKGITIAPSIRFWPTISSTLDSDRFAYSNKKTLQTEEIKTLDPGVGFTPFVFNISIGYSSDLRKK